MAFGGFANTALVLVASALFLAAAMTATGLDKRIALSILARVGTQTNHVVIGTILVGFVIAFMVPSTTARVACLPGIGKPDGRFGFPTKQGPHGLLQAGLKLFDRDLCRSTRFLRCRLRFPFGSALLT